MKSATLPRLAFRAFFFGAEGLRGECDVADEREVRKERDFWGNEHEYVYEGDKKVGEIKTEERGGFFGFGGDTVRVEYDTSGNETSYTKEEDRGGFLGFGTEKQEIRYDTSDKEIGHSRVESRGGFLGMGAHHVRIEYDNDDRELSQTNHERRGDFLGFGGQRVRVTRYAEPSPAAPREASDSDDGHRESSGSASGRRTDVAGAAGVAGTEGAVQNGSGYGPMLALLLAVLAGGLFLLTRANDSPRSASPAPAVSVTTQSSGETIDWTSPPRLTLRGLGPFRIGMSFTDAAAAYAGHLAREEGQVGRTYCALMPDGPDGLLLMFSDDRLVRIDVLGTEIASLSGARVGLGLESLVSLYGDRLVESPGEDEDGIRRFAFVPTDSADRELRMVFESDGQRVTRIRSGRIPEVEGPGGCS